MKDGGRREGGREGGREGEGGRGEKKKRRKGGRCICVHYTVCGLLSHRF